ncbi:hypothetical protein GCM10025783_03080 [Amnibacterium soli]|jgi:hypothetical protein|uniref:Uncharacterized protein n=1 Tax=Amnibacterium soli TaxID=1282736 RepID=A0ABP8YSX6_9MICO
MSHAAVHAVKLAAKHGPQVAKLIAKHGPQAVSAGMAFAGFLQKNPDLPAQVQERIAKISQRADAVKKDRSEAAQIREKLVIIRSEAHDLHAEDADFLVEDTQAWIARANGIEHALRLGEQQSKAEQKQTFTRLKTDAEQLLGEIIAAVAAGGTAEHSAVGV